MAFFCTHKMNKIIRENFLSDLSEVELLALLSASAVLRKNEVLNKIFFLLKERDANEEKIYESLLQIYLFAGYPCALAAFNFASEYFCFEKVKTKKYSSENFLLRGRQTSQKIYGRNLNRLISNIKSLSPDLSEWFIIEGYGKVLSRKNLSLKERELQIISILTCLKYEDQLLSHIIGALRNGATSNEVIKVIDNLRIFNSKSIVHYGLKVLSDYLEKLNAAVKNH